MPSPDLVKHVILHTSDSPFGSVDLIREWHLERGFNDVGYHFVILNGYWTSAEHKTGKRNKGTNGLVTVGRPLSANGAHAVGYNDKSIGVCLIGKGGVYTTEQIGSALALTANLLKKYKLTPQAVMGHSETASGKAQGKSCPDYDMSKFRDMLSTFLWAMDQVNTLPPLN